MTIISLPTENREQSLDYFIELKYILWRNHVSLLPWSHGVSTKLYFNLIFTMQTYKELIL